MKLIIFPFLSFLTGILLFTTMMTYKYHREHFGDMFFGCLIYFGVAIFLCEMILFGLITHYNWSNNFVNSKVNLLLSTGMVAFMVIYPIDIYGQENDSKK